MKKAKDQPESEPAELASLVGERIRKIRKEEGLSLELFALRCDMNAAYVGHIERGVQNGYAPGRLLLQLFQYPSARIVCEASDQYLF